MTSHVLFDFFGTLVQYSPSRTAQGYGRSHQLLRRSGSALDYQGFLSLWSAVFAELDWKAEQSSREFSMMDLSRAFLSRALHSTPSESIVSEFAELYVSEWNKGVQYPPGIRDLLERLARRFDLAIVTNTHDPALVPDHLGCMGISSLFQAVVTSVEYGLRKPDPAIFQHALEVLGASAEKSLYVGDSFEADYVGARSARIRALLIDPLRTSPVPDDDRLDSVFALEGALVADI